MRKRSFAALPGLLLLITLTERIKARPSTKDALLAGSSHSQVMHLRGGGGWV